MAVSKDKSFAKILKCIESCNTKEQITSVRNLIETYTKKFQDYESIGGLWIPYNIKYFKIKENGKRRR